MRLGKQRYESKYLTIQFFHKEKQWNIRWMCKQLGITRAAYYKWLSREVPEQEKENMELADLIREYDDRFGHILGYRRMTAWINHFNGTHYSKNRVHRIMKKINVHSVIRKKKKKYDSIKPETTAENCLQRDFHADNVNEKWTTDVVQLKIPGSDKKLHLSVILDLYDRSIVSYIVQKSNNNQLVFRTFDKAIAQNPTAKPMFHSDRGFQYTSRVFQRKLQDQEMEQSMSRVGHCIDNGPTEGFWGTLKTEMYQMYEIHDEATLREAIDRYIDFYNNYRPQERYNCKTPAEVRREAMEAETAIDYPIPENKRIKKYKEQWVA